MTAARVIVHAADRFHPRLTRSRPITLEDAYALDTWEAYAIMAIGIPSRDPFPAQPKTGQVG